MSTITFGKYNGYTAKEVAIADSGYAAWAAANLKSDFWRKEFVQALNDAKTATVEEVVAATVGNDAPEGAKRAVRSDYAKEQRHKSEMDALIASYAAQVNVDPVKLSEIIRGWMSRDVFSYSLDPKKFSSPAKYEACKACLDAAYELDRKHFLEL